MAQIDLKSSISKIIDANPRDRGSIISSWESIDFDDHSASQIIVSMSIGGHWDALSELLSLKLIRQALWLVIDDVARHAVNLDNLPSFSAAMPDSLDAKESSVILLYVVKCGSGDLAAVILDRLSEINFPDFSKVLELYPDDEILCRQLIGLIAKKIDWKSFLGFHSYHDVFDLVKDSVKMRSPTRLFIASEIMSDGDKASLLSFDYSADDIGFIVKHMDFSNGVVSELPARIKRIVLSEGMGV